MGWVRLHPYNIAQKVQIAVEHFRELVAPLPSHVVGQHEQEDVSPYAILEAIVDRTDLQIHALQRAKGAFNFSGSRDISCP